MSALAHLVAGDVRHFRLVIALWIGLVVTTTAATGVLPLVPIERGAGTYAAFAASLLSLAQFVLGIVLPVLVIQAHPLVGSDAFWMTRPVSTRTLFASKLAFLVSLLVLVPTLANAGLMAAHGVPVGTLIAVALEGAITTLLWTAIVVAAAALTSTLAQFALLAGGLLLGAAAGVSVLIVSTLAGSNDAPELLASSVPDPTGGFVFVLLTIAALAALLWVQYTTRLRVRAVAAGVAGVLIAVVVSSAWPWRFLAPPLSAPRWALDRDALQLSADPSTAAVDPEFLRTFKPLRWSALRARVKIAHVRPGWSASVGVRDASLRLESGATIVSWFPGYEAAAPVNDEEERPTVVALRRVLGASRIVDGSPSRAESAIVLFVRDADVSRLAPSRGQYRGRFEVVLHQYSVLAALPLAAGAMYRNGAYRLQLVDVAPRAGGLSIVARESRASSSLLREAPGEWLYFLRNRATGAALRGSPQDSLGPIGPLPLLLGGMHHGFDLHSEGGGFTTRRMVVRFPTGGPEGVRPSDLQPLDQMDLVLVRDTREGSVERTLEIPDFPLRVGSPSTAAGEP